jgi:hypothetical protein
MPPQGPQPTGNAHPTDARQTPIPKSSNNVRMISGPQHPTIDRLAPHGELQKSVAAKKQN